MENQRKGKSTAQPATSRLRVRKREAAGIQRNQSQMTETRKTEQNKRNAIARQKKRHNQTEAEKQLEG